MLCCQLSLSTMQFFRMRRIPIYSASRTWLYPTAPPPYAPLGDGTLSNYALDVPMNVEDCAEAGIRDVGCKERIPKKGWVGERDSDNRYAITLRAAGAIWREIITVKTMGKVEKDRRRALRVKVWTHLGVDTYDCLCRQFPLRTRGPYGAQPECTIGKSAVVSGLMNEWYRCKRLTKSYSGYEISPMSCTKFPR